ncbi:DEAD/DEAH box helicase family protein [Lysinibacillus sp. NPDC094177]|uniref:DEAD/DEAH box helicase family protein n=1 Tax=Lysinibacillus sp. NPDC094177 TaxID=3390580 RepID=UPI003D046C5B
MDTGAGKTLIGLLMLYSKAQEIKEPVVYLCPDNQLVEQVCTQANLYGIPVCKIEKNENYRQESPAEFNNSESVLVTTFERLFNGTYQGSERTSLNQLKSASNPLISRV